MSVEVSRHASIDETCVALADALAGAVGETAREASFRLALSGGSTPRRLYELLATNYRGRIDWARVELFWGDERPVPPDHPESNYRTANEVLIAPLEIPPSRVHRIRAEGGDRDAVAAEYQSEIARACGVDPEDAPPALDFVLLGMGMDGHTASLFPETGALRESKRWVVANDVPRLETHRFTMTPPLLNSAKRIAFLVTGGEKARRLAEVLRGPHDPMRLPSQLIRPPRGRVTWFVDFAAAPNVLRSDGIM